MSVQSLIVDVGTRLGRSASDVEPFIQALEDNWYDNVDSIADASADDLSSVGLPRRFAVEVAAAAASLRGGGTKGRERKGKGKGKDKAKEKDVDEEKGDRKAGKGKSRGGRSSGEVHHIIPIDLPTTDSEFKFRPKLLGNRGSHVFHIQDQTGVTVELSGVDEDGYLEMALTAKDEESMDRAANMCDDLINTVFDEYYSSPKGGGKSRGGKGDRESKGKKGKGKGKKGKSRVLDEDELEERIPVDTEGIDPEFHLRGKLVGEGGRNVKHIEQETGCSVQVERDNGDGMAFVIHGKDEGAIQSARDMCEDLLANVMEDSGATPSTKRSRGGKGSGKRSSKGKRRGKDWDDTDERPRKTTKTAE